MNWRGADFIRHYCATTIFVVATILSIAVAALTELQSEWNINTELQALLPTDERNPGIDQAAGRLANQFGDKLIIGFKAKSFDLADQAFAELDRAMRAADLPVASVSQLGRALQAQDLRPLVNHRFFLLTRNQRRWLSSGTLEPIQQRAAARLTGVATAGVALSPDQDPLALFTDYSAQLTPELPGEIRNDRLWIQLEDKGLALQAFRLDQGKLNLDVHDRLNSVMRKMERRLEQPPFNAEVEMIRSGVAFHAAEASGRARNEVLFIGSGSVIGIILLYVATFRSVIPLALSLGSILFGTGLAFVWNHAWYREIHLITLVFGASLIGVSIDYSLHFFTRIQNTTDCNSSTVTRRLLPALWLALITSSLGYLCLYQADMAVLRQMATFSVTGLVGAWLFVVGLYPHINMPRFSPAPRWQTAMALFPYRRLGASRNFQIAVFVITTGVIIAGASNWSFNSDIRTLYKPSSELLSAERTLAEKIPQFSASRFFYISASGPNQLLATEERFRTDFLDGLVSDGVIDDYRAISSIIPSKKRQKEHYRLQQAHLYAEDGVAVQFMRKVGFQSDDIDSVLGQFRNAAGSYLTVQEALPVLTASYHTLWLGQRGEQFHSMIALRGIKDAAALARAGEQGTGVRWVNRISQMSELLSKLAASAAWFLFAAYCIAVLIVSLRYKSLRYSKLVLLPLTSTLLAGSIVLVLGHSISIFHIFGGYLILGLGMDYGIFAAHGARDYRDHSRAIALSAATTFLSFGLLSLSSTPMVSAFGTIILLGIIFNACLYPLFLPSSGLSQGDCKADSEQT